MAQSHTIRARTVALFVIIACLLAGTMRRDGVTAQDATPGAASNSGLSAAVAWLQSQQGPDGGFLGFDGKPDPGVTADAVVALAAAEQTGVAVDLSSAVAYLQANGAAYAATNVGGMAKLALAATAAGADPTLFAGQNLLASATAGRTNSIHPLYGNGVFDHALVMLALAAHGDAVPSTMTEALASTRITDGSWAFDGSTEPGKGDSNTTALVIQALVASGHASDPMVVQGLAYLKTMQATTGGFAFQAANPLVPDANSTALAVQAIIAAGQDPSGADWKNATAALAAFQNPSGAFRYTDAERDDNLYATVQAVPALAALPLPIRATNETAPTASPVATPLALFGDVAQAPARRAAA